MFQVHLRTGRHYNIVPRSYTHTLVAYSLVLTRPKMADKETRAQYKKSKPEPSPSDSPIKAKTDVNSTMEMLLKKLADVYDLAKSTKQNTDTMQLELTAIRVDMSTINSKITDAEQRISDIEDTAFQPNKEIKTLLDITSNLKRHASDLEDRNRRGNIRILGIPGGSEDSADSRVAFLESWIPQITGIKFNQNSELDRAHRVPTFSSSTRKTTHPIICKPLRYQHTEAILNFACKNRQVSWEGKKKNFRRITQKPPWTREKGFFY